MVLSHFVAQDSDTSLPILLNMTTFLQAEQREEEEEEEVCLPDRQLSGGGEKPVWGAGSVSKHTRTIVFMCQRVWQGLQTEGGWWRAVQREDGRAGGGSWQEEIPEKKLGNNTDRRNAALCSAAGLGQSTSSTQRPAEAQRQRWEHCNRDWEGFLFP